MKKLSILFLVAYCGLAHAALEVLDNQALQSIDGQAGADLSLNLVLNQDTSNNFSCPQGIAYCHLAISVNKRFVQQQSGDVGNIWSKPDSNSGHKLWLVFKGIQGTINIQKLGLDGADLTYKDKSGTNVVKPAIQLGFSAAQPIQIRNFGFNALSIEQDNFVSSTTSEGSSSNPSDYGYLKANTYAAIPASSTTVADNYDTGKETGFMGIMMNGNLALQGKMMMFSCDGNHPRC